MTADTISNVRALAVSGVTTTGAKAWEVTSQTAAMLNKVVPTVLLMSARGNSTLCHRAGHGEYPLRVSFQNSRTFTSSRVWRLKRIAASGERG